MCWHLRKFEVPLSHPIPSAPSWLQLPCLGNCAHLENTRNKQYPTHHIYRMNLPQSCRTFPKFSSLLSRLYHPSASFNVPSYFHLISRSNFWTSTQFGTVSIAYTPLPCTFDELHEILKFETLFSCSIPCSLLRWWNSNSALKNGIAFEYVCLHNERQFDCRFWWSERNHSAEQR